MPYLGLEIFLWKLTIGQFSTYENVVIQNNETIEICMNDEIMEKCKCANKNKQESKKWKRKTNEDKSLKTYMHKEKVGNHMEDYLCVGVFIVSMIMQKLTLIIYKSCIVSFVIKNL